jgi:hypothetical protein
MVWRGRAILPPRIATTQAMTQEGKDGEDPEGKAALAAKNRRLALILTGIILLIYVAFLARQFGS